MNSNADELIRRLQVRSRIGLENPAVRTALILIGMKISGDAKLEATKKRVVDTGNLRARIRYELYERGGAVGVRIGVFGVNYAAINEFGGRVTPGMFRAMGASMSRKGGQRAPKGVIIGNYWTPRPFLRPAFNANAGFILDTLSKVFDK